ncbi:MAG: DUF1428 domain-containing protein [Pseudomonadota bacterium]
MSYVECYVAAVPNGNEETYKNHCRTMATVFRENGAIRAVDCWGAEVPDGEMTSFVKAVQAQEGETVCIGWVEWNSKAERDEGMAKAMKDERIRMEHMPFDGKRLIFAGFDIFMDQ